MGKQENDVETYLHQRVTEAGGTTRKFVSPGRVGVADRLVLFSGGGLIFVEVKTSDGKEESWQERERKRMEALAFKTAVVYGRRGVDALMDRITRGELIAGEYR